jgi:hypothetical protein
MRFVPAAFAMAAILATSPLAARAADMAPAPGATPQASELATPPDALNPADPDAPPPFMQRPKLPPLPTAPDLTYAVRPAPADFRGLAWGTPLAQAKAELGLLPVTSPRPLRDTYRRPDETLKLGAADIATVAYYFPKGVFSGAGVVFAGESNFFLVKDHLIELYGPGRQVGDRYGWTWTHVNIDLRLHDGMGELRYTYEP